MSRRFLLIAAASFALAQPLPAQDVPPAVENSRNAAIGQISGDAVYVRSGAGDNYYPTMKLNAGDKVTVVGERFVRGVETTLPNFREKRVRLERSRRQSGEVQGNAPQLRLGRSGGRSRPRA